MEENKVILLQTQLVKIIKRQLSPEVFQWLEEKGKLVHEGSASSALKVSFAAVARKAGRAVIEISADESKQIDLTCNGFSVTNWPLDKLCRLWLLLQVDTGDESYHFQIENLFRDAEMNELSALYAALPVLAYPESWQFRTTEGIRSNIGIVLDAIMYENPYPYRYLPESSWNQLVLKAFFNDKDINRIVGLDERSNKTLSSILIDYAHERQAAHRTVNPQLWRLVSKFVDAESINDIKKLFDDAHIKVRRAAVLACYGSGYEPAKRLLEKEPVILAAVKANQLNWNSL